VEIVEARSEPAIQAVRELMREYIVWTMTFFSDPESAPTFHNIERELQELPGVYAPPRGRLLLATHDRKPAGCVALKPIDETTSELKRLYVRPDFRGLRIGNQLVASLMEEARREGYTKMVLDSHRTMTAAHHIYRSAGFVDVETPADFPEQLKPQVVFMECKL
jgi:GNAT superfamily N-acetyltransferase